MHRAYGHKERGTLVLMAEWQAAVYSRECDQVSRYCTVTPACVRVERRNLIVLILMTSVYLSNL